MDRLNLPLVAGRGLASTGPAWTVGVALWSARHRWPMMLGWFTVTIGLFIVSQATGGIRAVSATSGSELAQTESGRAVAAMRSGTGDAQTDELQVILTSPSGDATDAASRRTVATIVARLGAVTATLDGEPVAALTALIDPYSAPATAGLIAPDRTSVRIVGRIEGNAEALETKTQALAPVIASLAAELPAYQVHAYGTTLLNDQVVDEINRDLDGATGAP